MTIPEDDPLARTVVEAIQKGNVDELRQLLLDNPELAMSRIVDRKGGARSLLHIAADWPGHFPNGARTVAVLLAAGAQVNAPMIGPHAETPLHWAASSNDVSVLDVLLDGGADIEAPGAIFTNGPAMSDAVIFAQWNAARRLLARGAQTTLSEAAALGLLDRVEAFFSSPPKPSNDLITGAFWHACRGGQRQTAEYLLDHGANLNWIGWDRKTPLQAAQDSHADDLIPWLRERGAKTAPELA